MLDRDKKLILIGCGKRGLGHLKAMEKFNKSPDVFCDFNPSSIDKISKTYKYSTFFSDIDSLIKSINLKNENYAIVAVDAKNNYSVAKKLLSNGINVLMEKPPGLSLDEGNSLVKASTNLECFIGFDRRFNPYVLKSIEILKDYGQIFNIHAEFNKDIYEWIGHRAFDDNLLDKMVLESPIHSIDLVNYLSGSDISELYASSRRYDSKYRTSFGALIEYKNGSLGTINSSYLSPVRLEKYSIHAKNCSIYLDGINSGKIFYNSKIFEMKIDNDLSSTELQMKNYLESIFEGKEFLGAKIEDSLNIFKITEKMFENTIT